jgi:hypothetical protein
MMVIVFGFICSMMGALLAANEVIGSNKAKITHKAQ